MAKENHGLPPEVHIDHWNEATNIYMVVVCVSLWFLYYFKRNGGRIVRILTRRNNEVVAPDVANNLHQEELKRVRLRQQLEHYYKARKWDQAQDQRIDME